MELLIKGILGAIKSDGGFRLSKTKLATHATGINAAFVLLPGALAGDASAIGQIVLLVVTWITALWARGNNG